MTPQRILERLNAEIVQIAGSAEVRGRFASQGGEARTTTREAFAALIGRDLRTWQNRGQCGRAARRVVPLARCELRTCMPVSSIGKLFCLMSSITPRVPDIDWSKGFDRHWCGGRPAVTHWYNAMSLLFPLAERFFRDTALEVAAGLDLSGHPQLQQDLRDFAAQESLHAAQHQLYNDVLRRQGYQSVADQSIIWWRRFGERHLSPLTRLAVVCTYEHYTAVLAENLLRSTKEWMRKSPDMALVWGWHAAEEAEHKSVCFDLYHVAGGGWLRRVLAFVIASVGLNLLFFGRQYLHLMRKDGHLRLTRLRRIVGSKPERRALLGPVGFDIGAALSYMHPSFHPWQRDNRAQMQAWLEANQGRLRVVGKSAAGGNENHHHAG